jgi:hypothetical protein
LVAFADAGRQQSLFLTEGEFDPKIDENAPNVSPPRDDHAAPRSSSACCVPGPAVHRAFLRPLLPEEDY